MMEGGMGIGIVWYAEERGKGHGRENEKKGLPEMKQQIVKDVFYSLTRKERERG